MGDYLDVLDLPQGGDNIPAGYEAVPLIEALNGPSVAPQQPTAPPAHEMYVQLPQNATDTPADPIIRTDASRYVQYCQ